ncbi:cyclopropane fatty-acyl-phospholipid synthase-like methyltransferase [Rhodoblastus acidophilus]|uniref:class I SAM-dependent methyltransferase n=1 Tax=Rhodoblastus acidophilus TaxID=1074 RepID=UPI002224DB1B|nr:class I SAM-dependent methyltransferase [Rhodoblastus acidophilus]MCW2285302.1 cyclopropane fatty-acyl-phospholipid synthase-like methyltransferase [Rhodoblastus acidophilus]MCW2334258.1 cyclopropane fatty-acyl-phospholipid synthase-like methyltransferase [Rhodoblastus acidophilus]
MEPRQTAPAVARNRDAILAVLRGILPQTGLVLEIASGTGEHAVHFAKNFPDLTFQPSDPDPFARKNIAAWIAAENLKNVAPPLALDASAPDWPIARADALLCINMVHISPWAATLGLFAQARRLLPAGAPLYLYGAYKRGGAHTAPSNVAFDNWLRAQNPEFGVRDLEALVETAAQHGFGPPEIIEMPANNLSLIFRAPCQAAQNPV